MNPSTPKGGQCFISPYGSPSQLNINVVRKKEKINKWQNAWLSPHYHSNSMENSAEIMYSGIMVKRVNLVTEMEIPTLPPHPSLPTPH